MSRLGKLPIQLGSAVQVTIGEKEAKFKGPQGEFVLKLNPAVIIKLENQELKVSPRDPEAKNSAALWGLMWSLTKNAVEGVSVGFTKQLEINGVGYRAALQGNVLNLNLGFSHPVNYKVPEGISASVAGNIITLKGIDKALVGETAAQIRKLRKPEPYKGKGIKYIDEVIRRKAGKTAAAAK